MRLGIFLLHDPAGQVGDHVTYLLAGFAPHLDRLVVVASAPPPPEAAARLALQASAIVLREPGRFAASGHAEGLAMVGFDALAGYDDIVLFDDTLLGPVFDPAAMFEGMSRRDADFWGATAGRDGTALVLHASFLVTRRRLHASPLFRDYWVRLPQDDSFGDPVRAHELRFTRHFTAHGFRAAVHGSEAGGEADSEAGGETGGETGGEAGAGQGDAALLDLPALLDRRVPVLPCRAFTLDAGAAEAQGGLSPAENLGLLAARSDFPRDLAWGHVIARTPVDALVAGVTRPALSDDPAGDPTLDPGGDRAAAALDRAAVVLALEDEDDIARIAGFLAPFDPARLHLVSTSARITGHFAALGWRTRTSDQPMTGAPLLAFGAELERSLADEDIVLNLSCFLGERRDFRFRDILIANYWAPLATASALAVLGARFQDNPRLGLAFAPTAAVLGRTTRQGPLCPRASTWSFAQYPGHVAGALGQASWPWRGNAALSARLARHPQFLAWLAGMQAAVRPGVRPGVAGIEAVLPELARGAGFAPLLAGTAAQAARLVARWSLSERMYREAITLQQPAGRAGEAAESAPAAAPAAAAPGAPAAVAPAAAAAPGAREAELLQEVDRLRLRNEAYDKVMQNLVPAAVRDAATVEIAGGRVRFPAAREGQSDTVMSASPFVFGAITELRPEGRTLHVKGWCYSLATPLEMLFVAVAEGGIILRSFTPCLNHRPNLRRSTSRPIPHENGGFALGVPRGKAAADARALSLVIVNQRLDAVFVTPLVIGALGEGQTLKPRDGGAA